MTDYIGRETAIAAIKSVPEGNWSNSRYVNELQSVPTADVRSVVYCKNCNLWFEDDKVGYENLRNVSAPCLYFSNLENSYTVYTKPNDYCSYGEEVEEK